MAAPERVEAIKPAKSIDDSSPQLQPNFDLNLQAAQRNPQNEKLAGASPSTGNTLSGIAHANGVSMQALYEANPQFDPSRADGIVHFDRSPQGGWDPDYIRPEDTIRVPTEASQVPTETAAARPPANGETADGTIPTGAVGDTPGASPRVELSATDRDNVIRTVWGEAAGQPPVGQEAVAHVIRNRVLAGYGNNATEVVHAPWQFEPWNTPAGRERMQNIPPSEYERIGEVVDRVFRGEAVDVTHGATHFYSPSAQAAAGRAPPEWATPATQLAEIGAHEFYAPSGPAHQAGVPTDAISARGVVHREPPPSAPPPPPPPEQPAAFDQAVADAQARRATVEGRPPESHGYETAVRARPDDSIEGIAAAHGADPRRTVEANRQFRDPGVINPGDIVFIPGQSPVSANTERLIDDAARFDREHPGANSTTSDENWNRVKNAIADELRAAGNGRAQPEQGAQETVGKISDWAIGTDRLRQASEAALQQVTSEWRAQGVTGDTLGKIDDAYGNLKDAQAHETQVANDPSLSGSAREVALNQASQETDRQTAAVRDEIASQLAAAGNANPDALPQDRIRAIQERAERIKALGPQESDFQALVGVAAHKVLVSDPAQRISDAYAQGGATRAAAALNTELSGTASDYAAQILQEAQPTVDRITSDLGDKVRQAGDAGQSGDARVQAFEDAKSIYSDLATGVQNAGMSGAYGRQAVDATADKLAAHTPNQGMNQPGSPLALVHEAALRDGSMTLSLAYAGALDRAGREADAGQMTLQIAGDIEEQRRVTERATDDFFKVTGELNQFRADWAGLLTKEQMDKATSGYVTRHPDFLGNFHNSLKTLQSEGNAADNMARSLAVYGNEIDDVQLFGRPAKDEVDKNWQKLTGENAKVAFAMQQGGQSNADIASAVDAAPGSGGPERSPDPVPTSRSVRTYVKEFMKARPEGLADTRAAQLNGAGSLLYGVGVAEGAQQVSGSPNLLNVANVTYQGLGFTKETAELLSRTAPQGLLDRSAVINRATDFVLKSPAWKAFDTYFKVGAVGLDTAKGVNYLLQGDPVAAGLSFASAGGNAMIALSAARAAGSATSLGALAARLPAGFSSGPWGAAIVVAATAGQFIWQGIKNAGAEEAFQHGARDFLIDSGAVDPAVAEQLSQAEADGGGSIGPLLGALADYHDTTGPQMLAFLNRQGADGSVGSDQLGTFLRIAEAVEKGDNGQFRETAPNDENFLPPGVPNYVPQPEGDRLPRSLRGLALRETAVFGFGDSPSAPVS